MLTLRMTNILVSTAYFAANGTMIHIPDSVGYGGCIIGAVAMQTTYLSTFGSGLWVMKLRVALEDLAVRVEELESQVAWV